MHVCKYTPLGILNLFIFLVGKVGVGVGVTKGKGKCKIHMELSHASLYNGYTWVGRIL